MQTVKALPYSHSLVDAGIDWITATRPQDGSQRAFEAVGEELLCQQKEEGRTLQRATLRDYTGYRGDSLFVGTREQDSIIVASSDVAARHWQTIARTARNVSRLDVQASVWTHGEQPALARWSYNRLKRVPPGRGRPRSFTLIRTHPYGETLNVGKRQSDCYGRLYDWSTAHSQGEAATIWRYEVEYKRAQALGNARTLLGTTDVGAEVSSLVHRWFSSRGLQPTWAAGESRLSNGAALVMQTRDPLAWFRSSVSKTVAREIKRHGLRAVVDALGLSDVVTLNRRR